MWEEDRALFLSMLGKYVSKNEKEFFEKMLHKMQCELAPSNELLISWANNDDNIYFVRVDYDEFLIGHGTYGHFDPELHTMNLSEALNANLCQLGFLKEDITLWQWLRRRDYEGMEYKNYAML